MDATERALFLKNIHLFYDLSDDQLLDIAKKFTEISFDTGDVILEQGTLADSLYIIYSGKVRVYHRQDGREQELAKFVANDYFGEMEILKSRGTRFASISAIEPTTLLQISSHDFVELVKLFPNVKPNIEISIASRKLARKVRFKWLRPDEVVYFLARKHWFYLLQTLIVPITLSLLAFLPLFGLVAGLTFSITVGAVVLTLGFGWITWRVFDWANDYYVVTNQRVVWLEKVIGLYDSRNEAPLTEIMSVGVDSDLMERLFEYGNVFVHTYVGSIPFRHVLYPRQAANMVKEYWYRTQQASEQADKEAFKDALRERLGLLKPSPKEEEPPKEDKITIPKKPNFIIVFFGNLFKQRMEEGDTVTYHKHLFILFQQIFWPSVALVTLLYFFGARLSTHGLDTIAKVLPFFMIPFLGWWLYRFIDWKNDIFQVTGDQILDIDKTPLGNVTSRAAPLDNILSTRYERVGIPGYILNYGTVYIDVGHDQFAFEDVLDPAAVQSDIDHRRLKRRSAKKAAERKDERNQMADWLISYDQNIDEIRREQELRNTKPKTE